MSTPIKTNKLIAKINYEEYEKTYDTFLIATSEKYLSSGSYVLDTPLLCDNVLSLCFESGKEFYVLMKKDDGNKAILKKALLESKDGDTLTISSVKVSKISDNILVQLLLNSLANFSHEALKFNNLTGHLYCFHPKWIQKGKVGERYATLKVPCLEFKVSNDMLLIMQVHTFTTKLLRNKMIFKTKKIEEYPKYVFSANNTLRRMLNSDDGNEYFIMRQVDGIKTEIPFLNIQNKNSFDICKMGILTNIMEIFNNKLNSICHLDFVTINNYISLERTRQIAKENNYVIKKILESRPIKIVDEINDEYSLTFCKNIREILEYKYSISATICRRPNKNALNICIVHNAIYYGGINDPHSIKRDGYSIQHITLEDFLENADFAISTIIHELIIKSDIIHGKITLFDWSKLGIQENISFGLRADEDKNRYFFMDIKADGSFTFKEQILDLFEQNNYSECVNIFVDNPAACGIIKRANGNINVISKTDMITIPEINQLNKELENNNTHLRGKAKREELLSSILDIKLYDSEMSKYYFVGAIGEGMRTKIITAANIRKITPYKNSPLMFDDLLPLMNVTFVRNGNLTVLPFPFKYLREYIKMVI